MIGRRVLVFILALAAAGPLWSGEVQAPARSLAKPIYAPAGQAWLKPAGKIQDRASAPAQVRVLIRHLRLPGRPEALQRQIFAPIAFHLQSEDLRLDSAALENMSDEDRQAAFELAAELAVRNLQGKAYELEERAQRILWAKSYDAHTRKSLFGLVSELKEVHDHYGAYLAKDQRRQLQKTYGLAAARAYEVRAALIGSAGEAGARALSAPAPAAPARGPPPKVPAAALKLLDEMENNKQNWGERDIGTLLVGFGFSRTEGSKHVQYRHPDFPQLTTSVSRQKDLPPGYARMAVKLAREVQRLRQEPAPAPAPAAAANAPRVVDLEELAMLLSEAAPAKTAAEEPAKPGTPAERGRAKARPSKAPGPIPQASLAPADKNRVPEKKGETPPPAAAEETQSQSLVDWVRTRVGL